MPSLRTNAIILGCRQARPTGQLLADILGWNYSEGTITDEIHQYRVVFRYGNTNEICRDLHWEGFTINNLASIKKASDKLECRRALLNNGIFAPKVWDINTYSEITKYPVIARPFHHSQGRNFLVVENQQRLLDVFRRGYYAQEVVEKEDEYRLFIFNGAILESSKKVPMRPDANPMIRNHRRGWGFKRVLVKDTPQILKRNAVAASKIVGLNFCAIDTATIKDGNAVVFEVNSAPGLIPRKAQKFAERFSQFLEEKGITIIGKKPAHIDDEINDAVETPEIGEVLDAPGGWRINPRITEPIMPDLPPLHFYTRRRA